MPRNPIDEIIERRRRERDAAGERYVDLAMDFELDGERLLSIGGRWDRRLVDYDGEAQASIPVAIHPGQRRAVEWFASWLSAHADRRDTPPPLTMLPEDDLDFEVDPDPDLAYAALFAGGRRAGKTWIAVAIAVAYALRFPNAIVWLVSPSDTVDDEMVRYATLHLASEWIDHDNQDGWWLCNGSQILLKSAFNPEALKQGEAHLIVLNEGQRMNQRAYVLSRGNVIDRSGIVIVCANPPVEAKDQQWVADFAAEAKGGLRAAVYFHFNSLANPHINREALLAMSREVDKRTADADIWGIFGAARDAVAYNWERLQNEKPPPDDLPDVTEALMNVLEEGEGIKQVLGLDVQRVPHIGGPIYRFFGMPDRDLVLAWIVGEVVLDGGDEVAWSDALYELGLDPAETLIICDASGRYQHSRRRIGDVEPPDWKGRGSFDVLRSEGWRRIQPPDRRQDRNPHIVDRVRAFTSMICSSDDRRRLFADPAMAPRTCKAIREWKTVHGTPSRTQEVAHLGDAASYPIIRLFPRILRSEGEERNPRRVKPSPEQETPSAIPALRPGIVAANPTPRLRGSPRAAGRSSRSRGP